MAGQLLPLRLLSSRGAFAFRLKTLTFSPSPSSLACSIVNSGGRCFSSRGGRPRDGGGFRLGRAAAGGGAQAKSLIEDEAELSDWVSDLKTDSMRLGLSGSDSEEGSDRDRRGGGRRNEMEDRVRVRDSGRFSERGRSRGSGGFSERNSRGSFSERMTGSDLEEEDGWRGSRGSNGLGKDRRSGGFSQRKTRGSVSKRRFGSDLEDDDDEEKEKFLSRQRRGQGSSMSFGKRGGRNGESSYKQGGRSLRVMSEEEEDVEDVYGFDDEIFGDKVDKKMVGMKDPVLKSGSSAELGNGEREKPVPRSSGGDEDSYLSNTRFDQCSISSLTLKGVKAVGYERMTLVQEATLPAILKGKDVLAKAKTGTGKTVAFLLPAIEIVSKLPPVDRDQKRPPINVLIICPTRELADQAGTEANTLLKFHPSIGVQVVIGGTRLALEQKRMQANPCQILVATPGRLRDHIENTPGFATRLMGVRVLVLDEADRLLDMGFRKDIEKIVAAVPKQRQTLLFSATVPDEVRQICYIAMKRDHEFVNTVGEGTEETHSQVRQLHLIAPLEKQFPILYALLKDHIAEDADYKVIVFCTTAMVTKLVADLLSELRLNVREIHSRKPQSYRTRVSKEFKESKGLILVSSDVSARGVDYPDVTLVVQVGVPADREQYIHRLGRTGRKGKDGQGILLLAPWEEFFLSSVKDLPMTKAPVPLVDPDTRKKVERALGHVEMKNKESAYQAWLGYYNSNKMVGRDKCKLVLLANEFSRSMGLENPPAIPKLVLRKMGLNNVPGLRSK